MSEVRPRVARSDADIVALVSAAVHAPFEEVWRRHRKEAWRPVRRALEKAEAAHERARGAIAAADAQEGRAGKKGGATGDGGNSDPGALARYRDAVSEEVVEPIRVVLNRPAATALEASLAAAADRARASLEELPAVLQAPTSGLPAGRPSGVGPIRTIKRAAARMFGPALWRGRTRRVPVARLARQHLDQAVLRAQTRGFRQSQRDRTEWLGRLERAWATWAAPILRPLRPAENSGADADSEGDEVRAYRAAGTALQAELRMLVEEAERTRAGARGADFRHLEELLAASVAVSGTFAADPPSSRPGAGLARKSATGWDAWAEGAAARLELYQSLVAMRRSFDDLLVELRKGWSRAIRHADEALAEVSTELERGGKRVERLSLDGEALALRLEAERKRTDGALARIHGTLPEPDAVFEALNAAVEETVRGLDAVRERMPAGLDLHDIPAPGDSPRKPTTDPRSVRPREAFLQAFDLLRRERMRAAPSAIRDAMHRVRSEVAELREVSGYGYEAAAAEAKDRHSPDAPHPAVLAANGLARAGNKVAAARVLMREALLAARTEIAVEIDEGSRQMIERMTADGVVADYLEARTHLTAWFVRAWVRVRRGFRAGWARGKTAALGVRRNELGAAAFLRRLRARLGLGPSPPAATGRRDRSLAHADEYPHALPIDYRRLFSLEPLTDARLLAGRDDALAAVEATWARRASGEARSLAVLASPGVGTTSFLNVVAARLSKKAPDGMRREFATRVRAEARLAKRLAEWMGLEDARDLDSLAVQVLEAAPGSIPDFVILEATEHLHLRAPGGGKLFERLLTFMSRTESKVFWIAAMTSSAWQLVERRAPAFVHRVERVAMEELSPEELRRAVLARHRLSGLPLRFAESRDGRVALRRQARWLRSPEKRARLVEADYFQRLHRVSGGSPRLALFHWLRSADFATAEGNLLVHPLSPLDSGIGTLDRTQGFTLKAILDHGTLTVDEHCEVARMSEPESLHILRALEEDRVIEKVRGALRYRIRPLMVDAVAAHLRSRNILH